MGRWLGVGIMRKIDKKHIIAFELIVTALLLFFYYMFQTLTGRKKDFSEFIILNLLPFVFIASVDLFIIHTLHKKLKIINIYIRVILDLVTTSLFSVLIFFLGNFVFLGFGAFHTDPSILTSIIFIVLWNSIVVLLIEVYFYSQRQSDAERRIAVIEKEKLQYQYETLKAQINPHFLFNSLNVLASLAYEDAEKANLFAKKMSGVYRYVLLTNTRPLVPLREELAFLDSYIFLEQIRFEDNFTVTINNHTDLNRMVIPVSLQLLVENAIKHNITTSNQPLRVTIEISDEEMRVSNNLQLRSTADRGGVGLKNLDRQYALYDKTIEIIQTETEFIVKIPFLD